MNFTKKHFDIYNKILFAVLGILLITWFSSYVMEKLRLVKKEAFLGIPGLPEDESDKVTELPELIKKIPREIEEGFKKLIQPFVDFINGVDNLFNHGIPNHLACGKSMADSGWNGGTQVFGIQFMCFWDKFVKFFNGDCTLYYVIDIVCKTLTLIFIRLPLTILKAIFGIDFHFVVDLFKSFILVPLNELFVVVLGFGFLQWSDTIIERCYRCKGEIKDSSGKVVYSDSKPFGDWSTLYSCSDDLLKKGVDKIFFSAFPSAHWDTWYKGRHLDGWDDQI
jgi:hypothetical protein